MGISCQKQWTLNVASPLSGDTGMDQAIYEPVTGKIFGVRGQWLFQFNATTGVLENSLRFAPYVTGPSTITTISGKLYIGTTFSPTVHWSYDSYLNTDIYEVNAASFTFTRQFGMGVNIGPFYIPINNALATGFYSLTTDGTYLYAFMSPDGFWKILPATAPAYTRASFACGLDFCYDTLNGVLWVADNLTPNLWVWPTDFHTESHDGGYPLFSSGVTFNNATNKVYTVGGNRYVSNANAGTIVPAFNNFTQTTYDTGRANAVPFRLKSVNGLVGNPYNGKILIPTWSDNAVVVWDPVSDTVSATKIGFTQPFDIVNTPTKSFAVQTGLVGLKEIV